MNPNWFENSDESKACGISPVRVVNVLKTLGAPKSRIDSIKNTGDMCKNISGILSHRCLKGWTFHRFLGKGVHGAVFEIENSDGKQRAVKILSNNPKKEVRIQKKLAKIGVSPQVYSSCKLNESMYAIVMDRVDGNLEELVGSYKTLSKKMLKMIFKEIVRLIEVLRDSNVSHGDLSQANLGYIIDGDDIHLTILDTGWSAKFVPMFDALSLTQSLIFTSNSINRDFLFEKLVKYIGSEYGFNVPVTTTGLDDLWGNISEKFVIDFKQSL